VYGALLDCEIIYIYIYIYTLFIAEHKGDVSPENDSLCLQILESTITIVINPLKTKRRLLSLNTQYVPRSKHFSSRL